MKDWRVRIVQVTGRCMVSSLFYGVGRGGQAEMLLGLLLTRTDDYFDKSMISGRFTRREVGRLSGGWLST